MVLIWPPWQFRLAVALATPLLPSHPFSMIATFAFGVSAITGMIGAFMRKDFKELSHIISGVTAAAGLGLTAAGVLPPVYGVALCTFAAVMILTASMRSVTSHSIGGATQAMIISGYALAGISIFAIVIHFGRIQTQLSCLSYNHDPELYSICEAKLKEYHLSKLMGPTPVGVTNLYGISSYFSLPTIKPVYGWATTAIGMCIALGITVLPWVAKSCGASTFYAVFAEINEKSKNKPVTDTGRAYSVFELIFGCFSVEYMILVVCSFISYMYGDHGGITLVALAGCVVLACLVYSQTCDDLYKGAARAQNALGLKIIPTEPSSIVGHTPELLAKAKFDTILHIMGLLGTIIWMFGITGSWYAVITLPTILVIIYFYPENALIPYYCAYTLMFILMGDIPGAFAMIAIIVQTKTSGRGFKFKTSHLKENINVQETPRG
nr:hypothetical protein [Amarillovirales sp.]